MLLIASLVLFILAVSPLPASAWNIPGHMLSGIIAYQVLQQENPATIEKVKAVLEKHPWYANQWQARLQDVSVADHDMVLFMQAVIWADDVRMSHKQQHRGLWHFINWRFKPEGQPASVQIKDLDPVNILRAWLRMRAWRRTDRCRAKGNLWYAARQICGDFVKGHWLDRCKSHALSTS